MKVAIISFKTYEYGGVERYAYELANHLAKKVEVHLFTNKFVGETDAKVHLVPAIGKKDLFSVNSFMYFLSRRLKRKSFDIIHSMGPLYLYPDVVTVHMCQKRFISRNIFKDFSFIKKYYWIIRTMVAANFQRISFNNAKKVIAVSSSLVKELDFSYGVKEPIVIYPGIERKFFQEVDSTVKEKKKKEMGIDNNAFVILFVGGQWERKGLKYAIRALSLLSKSTLLLVIGSGNIKKYMRLAEEYEVDKRVIFLGFQKVIFDYYLVSDILVLPSLYEGFGYPVLEAMAMGLPVIVSRDVGASELVRDRETGFVIQNPYDYKEISSRIASLIGNKTYYSYSSKARDIARGLSWENTMKEILAAYDEVLKNGQQGI